MLWLPLVGDRQWLARARREVCSQCGEPLKPDQVTLCPPCAERRDTELMWSRLSLAALRSCDEHVLIEAIASVKGVLYRHNEKF